MTPLFNYTAPAGAGSLLAAFAIGLAFGWALERAGLGQADKLAGQFYFVDFTVFKVMFSAILTAGLGAFLLGGLGVLDLSRVYVPQTYVVPQIAGGLIFGIGFIAAGLCPGTSCVAAASGRTDGAAVIVGLLAGVTIAGFAVNPLAEFYNSTARGTLTLPDYFGLSTGTVLAVVTAIALLAFAGLEWFERRGTAATPRVSVELNQ